MERKHCIIDKSADYFHYYLFVYENVRTLLKMLNIRPDKRSIFSCRLSFLRCYNDLWISYIFMRLKPEAAGMFDVQVDHCTCLQQTQPASYIREPRLSLHHCLIARDVFTKKSSSFLQLSSTPASSLIQIMCIPISNSICLTISQTPSLPPSSSSSLSQQTSANLQTDTVVLLAERLLLSISSCSWWEGTESSTFRDLNAPP